MPYAGSTIRRSPVHGRWRAGGTLTSHSKPSLFKLKKQSRPQTTWSWTRIPITSATCRSRCVMSTSSCLGEGSPKGTAVMQAGLGEGVSGDRLDAAY